jgi:hypothetical protein
LYNTNTSIEESEWNSRGQQRLRTGSVIEGPAQSQAVAGAQASIADKAKVPETRTFQVRSPAFSLVFVGYVDGGRLMLTPVVGTPRYDLSAGTAVAADQVFARVKPDAERDPGLPR